MEDLVATNLIYPRALEKKLEGMLNYIALRKPAKIPLWWGGTFLSENDQID